MDKGAHYYRCDFQIHTPRDLSWNGQCAVTAEERKAYSEELIGDCRRKGIEAIAVTDHHDFAFYPYIRKASQDELDEQGKPISTEQRIIIFPGIELTLTAPNCQALLILDSNFPENLLHSVLVALAITPNRPEDSKHAPVVRIPQNVVNDLSHLYRILNQHDHLKGRFIVLPNVKENGYGTLLRSGFANFYKSMPCVGGYTEGILPQPGTGAYDIIHGKNREYGFKTIGVFQTSDNRKRNNEDIGTYSTWVKWATPTAEALRQACLAKESRISQSLPLLPTVYITSVDVTSSKFMGQIYLELNKQYNAIIGGRGTGKSTILEYLRWGLADQVPGGISDSEEIPNYHAKRKKLIEKTLIPFDATVQISFMKNNIPHIVRRKCKINELSLKIGTGEFEICSEDNIRNLLPIQAYSQKQLSSVGVSIDELKRLIYSPIRQTLDDLDSRFEKLRADIRSSYELRQRKRAIESEIERNKLELKSLTEQVEGLRKELKGISDDDRTTIVSHKQYEIVEDLVNGWKTEITLVKESLSRVVTELAGYPTTIPLDVKLLESEQTVIEQIHKEITSIFQEINSAINLLNNKLDTTGTVMAKSNTLLNHWKAIFDQHKKKYDAAKQKSTAQETTLNQIQKIEDRIKEIGKALSEKKQSVLKTGDPETGFEKHRNEWLNAHREKGNLLQAQCEQLSILSDGNLKATLSRGKGTAGLEEALKKMTAGANIRKDKIDDLCKRIRESEDPIHEWQGILNEFETIALFEPDKNPTAIIPATVTLTSVGFSDSELGRVAQKINNDNWIDLFLVQLDDLPVFEYCIRQDEYIDFGEASAGQQATALMHVLLNQEGPPLIIDQPEDDLDNQMVSDIAALVWKSKMKRQLIFSSHNANIVVNGDAELVVCCDYKVTGDQSKGEISKQGAIDIKEIRDQITKVMEGGEEAFKLRKEKYGF